MELMPLTARSILWKEYGIVLPNFDGDDAVNAIIKHSMETKRQEYENKRATRKSEHYG